MIAGSHGGRPLVAPRGSATRPTGDRVREALFSILGDLDGLEVLDLFAGSGALAIEALSRGAAAATLVDSAPAAIAAIRRNLDSLGLEAEVRRATRDAGSWGLHGRTVVNTIWSSSIPHTVERAASDVSSRPLWHRCSRPAPGWSRRATAGPRCELDLPLTDERRYGDTLIRIHDAR